MTEALEIEVQRRVTLEGQNRALRMKYKQKVQEMSQMQDYALANKKQEADMRKFVESMR